MVWQTMFGNPQIISQDNTVNTVSKYLQLQMVWHASYVVKYFTGNQIRQLKSSLRLKDNERCILSRYCCWILYQLVGKDGS